MGKLVSKEAFNSWSDKHGLETMFYAGVIGMSASVVLSVINTVKAVRKVDARKKELGVEKLDKKELIKTVWKLYLPPAILTIASGADIVIAANKSTNKTAMAISACQLAESAAKTYQEKVIETIGEKKEKDIRDEVAKEEYKRNPVNKSIVKETGKGEYLFYEPVSKQYFRSHVNIVDKRVNEFNKELMSGFSPYASLNDWLYFLEIGQEAVIGEALGWSSDTLLEIEYCLEDSDGEPCYIIEYVTPPTYNYKSLH